MRTELLKRLRREAGRVKFTLKDDRTLIVLVNGFFGDRVYLDEDFYKKPYVPKEKVRACQRKYIEYRLFRMKCRREDRKRKSALKRLNKQEW